MSRVCQITKKHPMVGNNVSHSNRKTRRRFDINLHTHRIWLESERRYVSIRTTTRGLRKIDRDGIESILEEIKTSRE